MPTIDEIKNYWQNHPLLSYELDEVGSAAYFENLDRIKRTDSDRFALNYWDFHQFSGKKVLDVGCGPGWITVNYAAGNAEVTAVDLTPRAVDLTLKHLAYRGLKAKVMEGSAENLPFPDGSFDLVVSSGVLHHTSDCHRAITECHRVLTPGGQAKISLYRKGMLHSRLLWPLVKAIGQLFKVKHPGSDLALLSSDVDDFIRRYDGDNNPVGIGMSNRQWALILEQVGFVVEGQEVHYFPARFLPMAELIPVFIHRLVDRAFGTMVYFKLRKPLLR